MFLFQNHSSKQHDEHYVRGDMSRQAAIQSLAMRTDLERVASGGQVSISLM